MIGLQLLLHITALGACRGRSGDMILVVTWPSDWVAFWCGFCLGVSWLWAAFRELRRTVLAAKDVAVLCEWWAAVSKSV